MRITTRTIFIVILASVLSAAFFIFQREPLTTSPDKAPPKDVEDVALTIIAFGDSLTAGYGLPLYDAYPAQLEEALIERGYDVTVINSGVSGETTAGALTRANFIRSQNPDLVLLGIGGNDALRATPLTTTSQNLRAILDTLTEGSNAPHILLLQMQAPSNEGVAYKNAFDTLYTTLSDEYDIPLVPFIVEEVSRNQALLLPDGIHPNREGYAVLINSYLLPAVITALEEG